jgi:hypothetical protein
MFTGYQILIVLGVAVLAAYGVGALSRQLRPGPLQRGVLTGLLLLGAGLPLVQATSMISRIGAVSNASQFDAYHALPFPKPAEMMQVARFRPFSPTPRGAFGNQTLMLQRGYWIANCYSNLALPAPHPRAPVARTLPLSSPPPIRIDRLRSDRLTLAYGRSRAQNIRLNLRALESFRFDAPVASRDGARVTFSRNQLSDDKLTIIARYPGLAEGALASVAGLSASAGFFAWLVRRKGGSRPT